MIICWDVFRLNFEKHVMLLYDVRSSFRASYFHCCKSFDSAKIADDFMMLEGYSSPQHFSTTYNIFMATLRENPAKS